MTHEMRRDEVVLLGYGFQHGRNEMRRVQVVRVRKRQCVALKCSRASLCLPQYIFQSHVGQDVSIVLVVEIRKCGADVFCLFVIRVHPFLPGSLIDAPKQTGELFVWLFARVDYQRLEIRMR